MFSPDTTRRLTQAASLANTAAGNHGGHPLPERLDPEHLAALLAVPDGPSVDADSVSGATLRAVKKLRAAVAGIWHDAAAEDATAAAAGINQLLSAAGPVRLVLPDGPGDAADAGSRARTAAGTESGVARTPAVLEAGRDSDPVEKRLSTAIALALTDVALAGELTRLRTCSGEDCENAFVDLTRNRSKQFCDEANCANRAHVRAYRARRAAEAGGEEGSDDESGSDPDRAQELARDPEGKKPRKSSSKKDKGKKKSKKDKKK